MNTGESNIEINPDYLDFLRLLNVHEVEYLVIGAFAYGVHCRPRNTKDLDIFVSNDSGNATKVLNVLSDFGFQSLNLTVEDLTEPDTILQLGYEPRRIDITTDISGIDFTTAWKNRIQAEIGGELVSVISKQDLITNKKASGRLQDLADVGHLTTEPVSREEAFKKHPPRSTR